MPRTKPTVIFDCNIVWQAFFFAHGVAGKCKKLVDEGRITLVLSAVVLDEMREVMTRPEMLERYGATSEMVDAYLQNLKQISIALRSVPKVFSYPRDPDDEPYINLAVAAGADYIVTRDKDLLDLMTGYTDEAKEFRQRFRPLRVVDPVAFLREIEKAAGKND